MIYNADEVTFILKKTLDEAKQWAIMYCDHSYEIIVREISNIEYKYCPYSQQRELLLAYEEFTSYKVLGKKIPRISKQMVEDYLANNCG